MTGDVLLDAKRILVLAPHPDDETLGCGGTLAICSARGADVHVAVVSDGGGIAAVNAGSRLDITRIREEEAREACSILGVKEVSFLGYPDGELKEHERRIRTGLVELIDRFMPEIVLCPSPLDYHDDHISVSKIAAGIAGLRDDFTLVFFQVYGTLRFNTLVDISSVLEVKTKAILRYQCSLFGDPELFADAVKGVNRFWSFYTRGPGYYEAFFVVPPFSDREAIMRWLTYGETEVRPEQAFLSRLNAADELLFALKEKEGLLAERNSELAATRSLLEEKEKDAALLAFDLDAKKDEIASAARQMEETEKSLESIAGSIVWRVALRFYRLRDWALPARSTGRKIYDNLVSRIKRS